MSALPLPIAFGLPEKFAAWRPEQEAAIDEVIDSEERFVALCLSTGSGKSLIPFAVSRMMGLRTVILTSTTALQDQYSADFRPLELDRGFADLRGRGRYECLALKPGGEFCESEPGSDAEASMLQPRSGNWRASSFISVEQGPCNVGVDCSLRHAGCQFYDAVKVAKSSQVVVTSYAKWLTADIENEMGRFDLLVMDEAHSSADELASALAVEIEYWEVESLLGVHWPQPKHQGGSDADGGGAIRDWILWARNVLPKLKLKLEAVNAQIRVSGRGGLKRELVATARKFKALDKKLTSIAGIRGHWIADDLIEITRKGERQIAGVRFDPVWPAPYAEEKLFRGIGKVLLISATVRPKSLEVLGIGVSESKFVEYPSSFPVVRRPITIVPTVRMSYKMTDKELEKLIARIDEVIETRIDKRILLFTVSYARAKLIVEHSRWKSVMVTHGSGGLKSAIEEFKSRKPPVVLVGPAHHTGVDFPMTDAEVGLVVKIPFPDLRSRVLKARILSDKEYGNYLAAQDLVQSVGRGMRSISDRFESIIIDSHASWFIFSNKKLFPKYFLNAVRKSPNGLPRPLPKL